MLTVLELAKNLRRLVSIFYKYWYLTLRNKPLFAINSVKYLNLISAAKATLDFYLTFKGFHLPYIIPYFTTRNMELIERDSFIASLQTKFKALADGEGHCVFITGEAG